jgi:hypothetical protein
MSRTKAFINKDNQTFRVKNDKIFDLLLRGWQLGKDPSYQPNPKRSKRELSYEALLEFESQDEHNPLE